MSEETWGITAEVTEARRKRNREILWTGVGLSHRLESILMRVA